MIDSVSKIQYVWCKNWLYCFKTKELMGCNEICTSKISPPTFAQVASEAALDTPQSYFDEWSEYRERRDTLITELHKIEGAVYSKGAFYCIAELPIENADDFADGF
jgi:aspartate aminotransferase